MVYCVIATMVGLLWLFYSGGPVKRRLPAVLAFTVILFIVIYTLFTGATPSVVRAAIMVTVLLLGPVVGRRYDPVAALSVSAAVMVLFAPELLGDTGFLLSFGAMLGIATVSPVLQEFLTRIRIPYIVAIPISVSLGAVAATIPLSALLIGQVSLVGPLATLTSDFALAPLMLSGIATILLGVVSAQAAAITGLLTWVSAGWLLASAQLWASLPFASISTGGVTMFQLVTYYVVLVAVIMILANPQRRARLQHLAPGAGTAVLAAGAVVVWAVALFLLGT
jgi:competence protein ComEC